jgi:6-phosphogluconolactonase
MRHLILFILPALIATLISGCSQKTRMVAGGFSENGENGISIFDFNSTKGTMELISSFNAGPNPSYLCISEKNKLIYAINEVSEFNGVRGGGVTAVRYVNNFENLTKAGEIPVPNGGPCFISLTPCGKYLLVANYGGGSVAVVKLGATGIPEAVTDTIIYTDTVLYRKDIKVSHAHMIGFDPSGEKVYVTDLGLDRIMIYSLNYESGKLIPLSEKGIALAPYTGPRHFVFNSEGTMLYVMGELNSAVTVFRVGGPLGLREVQTISALGQGFTGKNSSADIHIGKSGKFLYATNRGENSIATFRIGIDGLLSLSGHTSCGGNWPRNFAIDPSGRFLLAANQRSGNIAVFKIDPLNGIPADSTQNVLIKSPSCIKFHTE